MKTIKILMLSAILATGLPGAACKTSKSASSSARSVVAENYRLVIAFISIGTGTDQKAMDAITKFIEEHPKKPVVEKHPWGREGEVDYCMKLDEFSKKEQEKFIEEVKKLAGSSDLVRFSENAPCVHKK